MTRRFQPIKEILKSTGEHQRFSARKFRRSLERAGASTALAKEITADVEHQSLDSTKAVHNYAFRQLQKKHRPLAARYNLKRAIMQLGPSGYPFEKFVGALLAAKGYKTRVGQVMQGFCVRHEVDVVARKENEHIMVECKFHNQPGLRSNVKTALYIKARFDDIISQLHHTEKNNEHHEGWIVTNTQFSKDAERYARCAGIRLISWHMPKGGSLATWIDETGLHPISALTYLTQKQKQKLTHKGLILCRDVKRRKGLLRSAGVPQKKIDKVVQEAEAICQLRNTL